MLRILPALGAEPAADITGDDPDLAFREAVAARQATLRLRRIATV
jgi:hypothetical protein